MQWAPNIRQGDGTYWLELHKAPFLQWCVGDLSDTSLWAKRKRKWGTFGHPTYDSFQRHLLGTLFWSATTMMIKLWIRIWGHPTLDKQKNRVPPLEKIRCWGPRARTKSPSCSRRFCLIREKKKRLWVVVIHPIKIRIVSNRIGALMTIVTSNMGK